MIIEDSRNAIA